MYVDEELRSNIRYDLRRRIEWEVNMRCAWWVSGWEWKGMYKADQKQSGAVDRKERG
jgi:hypothetical protein